jgi:hypothetical protein
VVIINTRAQQKTTSVRALLVPKCLPVALGSLDVARLKADRAGLEVSKSSAAPIWVVPWVDVPEQHAVVDAGSDRLGY